MTRTRYSKKPYQPSIKGLFVAAIIAGGAGLFFLAQLYARGNPPPTIVKNPAFAYTCGFDAVFLIDKSYSQTDALFAKNKKFANTFIDALGGSKTHFMVIDGSDDLRTPYTSSTSTAKDAVNGINIADGDDIDNLDYPLIQRYEGRKGKQKIIFVATDGQVANSEVGPNKLKKAGARIVMFLNTGERDSVTAVSKLSGPRVDTGSIFTSDIILNSDYKKLAAQLRAFEREKSCTPPNSDDNGGGGGGSGDGGSGDGNGNGNGGSGTGTNGTGSGGGGSSATKSGDKPKSVPKPAPQGTVEQDPPKPEPSAFFDGKQYSIGSDPDAQTPADLVTNPEKVFNNVWFYVIAGIVIAGGGGGGYWWWKRKHKP